MQADKAATRESKGSDGLDQPALASPSSLMGKGKVFTRLRPPDSILALSPRIFSSGAPLPGRSPLRPCEPARRNVEPPI
eukprot:scaffold31701_cov36-Phaeocystis_antarctica.AAC.2